MTDIVNHSIGTVGKNITGGGGGGGGGGVGEGGFRKI